MFKPEVFFSGRKINEFEEGGRRYALWRPPFHDSYTPDERIPGEPSLLINKDIGDFLPVLFEDDDVLQSTLNFLGMEATSELKLETVEQHQAGKKGLIRIVRASDGNETAYFVVHISRFPESDPESSYLQREFTNLQYISGLFQDHVRPAVRKKYDVVMPIAGGLSGNYRSNRHPYFTMPFIATGELHQSVVFRPESNRPAPYFIYAIPYTEEMDYTAKRQILSAHLPEGMRKHHFLSLDFLVFNSLIYYLSGGRMLNDIRINAGDFMANIKSLEMDLTLVSIRDGFSPPVSEEDFITALKNHRELCYMSLGNVNQGMIIRTFFGLADEFFYDCLREARELIKS